MKWYLAKIVFRIICGEGSHMAQFDEQLRLIAADDRVQAYEKAFTIGRNESDNFVNMEQQLVQWTFVDVAELYELTSMTDGAELYARIQEYDDANSYIETVRRKALVIREQLEEPIQEIA